MRGPRLPAVVWSHPSGEAVRRGRPAGPRSCANDIQEDLSRIAPLWDCGAAGRGAHIRPAAAFRELYAVGGQLLPVCPAARIGVPSDSGALGTESIRAANLRVMKALRLQLEPHAPEGHDVDVAPFLFRFPGSQRGFGPDLHVADEAAFDDEGRHADATALSLAAELTSDSTKDVDWLDKTDTYGRIVPVYLLLDMKMQEINVFWDPSPKGYRSRTNVPFGRPVRVPAPFDFELDTSAFITEAEAEAQGTTEGNDAGRGTPDA